VREDLSFEVIDREKAMVRLGAGGLDGKALTAEAMTSALQALAKFNRLAKARQVDAVLAAATSATREARNGGEFLARIERETGIRARIITGPEEARLIHQAAVYGVDVGGGRAVVIDIGGGSVEITLGTASAIQLARSFKLGVIRLTERFVRSDPLTDRDERRMVKHIHDEIDRYCSQITEAGFDRVIGTSGTILSLGAVASTMSRGTLPPELRTLRVTAKQLRRVRKTSSGSISSSASCCRGWIRAGRPDGGRRHPARHHPAASGRGGVDAVRSGAARGPGARLRPPQQAAHRARGHHPDVRRRSIIELAERCHYDAAHAQHIAGWRWRCSTRHGRCTGMTDREREWLELASLLHDIGAHISFVRHHRHSYYLIKNGDLRGFQPDEIEVIALVARYHRRGTPKSSHDEYAGLPAALRRTVRILASIPAGGRKPRSQPWTGDFQPRTARWRRHVALRIRTAANADAELELWATARHLRPFEKLIGKTVKLEVASEERRVTRRAAGSLASRHTVPSTPLGQPLK
jgi:exopolyphosphatase/guanosine-5'-triphosphate,3'-diphosphate pyrophosphatase